jgi:hypothetical protein
LQDPPKFTQIGIFGLKKYHLATLRSAPFFGVGPIRRIKCELNDDFYGTTFYGTDFIKFYKRRLGKISAFFAFTCLINHTLMGPLFVRV